MKSNKCEKCWSHGECTPDEKQKLIDGINANLQQITKLKNEMEDATIRRNDFSEGVKHRTTKFKDTAGNIFAKRNPKNAEHIRVLGKMSEQWREAIERGDMIEASRLDSEMREYHMKQVKMVNPTKYEYDMISRGDLDEDKVTTLADEQDIGKYLGQTIMAVGATGAVAGMVNNAVNAEYANFLNEQNDQIYNMMNTNKTVSGQEIVPGLDTTAAVAEDKAVKESGISAFKEYNDAKRNSPDDTLSGGMKTSKYQTEHSKYHHEEPKLVQQLSYDEVNQKFATEAKEYLGHTVKGSLYPTEGRKIIGDKLKLDEGGTLQEVPTILEKAAQDRIVSWTATVTSAPVSHVPYSFDPRLIGASTAAMAIVGAHSAPKSNKPTDKYKVAQDDKKTTDDKTKKTKMTKKKEEEQER